MVIFVKAWCCAFATFLSRETLHASVFELNKYAETTTPFIIYLSLSNFTTENLTFTQKSISELKRQKKFVEKLYWKQQMEITLWLLCVFTLPKNVVATLCLRSWFLWWNHVSRESSFLYQKTPVFLIFWRKITNFYSETSRNA